MIDKITISARLIRSGVILEEEYERRDSQTAFCKEHQLGLNDKTEVRSSINYH